MEVSWNLLENDVVLLRWKLRFPKNIQPCSNPGSLPPELGMMIQFTIKFYRGALKVNCYLMLTTNSVAVVQLGTCWR